MLLSTQYKKWFTGLANILFESWLWKDLTMILPSKVVVVEAVKQEYSGMYESLRLLNLTHFYNKRMHKCVNNLAEQQVNNNNKAKNTRITLFTPIPSSTDL